MTREEKQTRRRDLVMQGPVGRSLWRISMPMFWGIFAMTIFNLTDTWFVAQLGTEPLAAMGFSFPVILLLNGITFGIGTGVTSVVSQRVGAGAFDAVRCYVRDGLILAVGLVAIIATVGLLTVRPVFAALGAQGVTLDLVSDYMRIWYIGSAAVVIPMVGNSAIRGTGDATAPAWIMSVAALTNIALDPIFIFGWGPVPGMGLEGAAIATVIARTLSLFAALGILLFRDHLIALAIPKPRMLLRRWWDILHVGAPATGVQLLGPITMGVIVKLVDAYGEEAVAAFGAGVRVEMFALMIPMALASGMLVYVGQHWGAGAIDRLWRGIRTGERFLVIAGLASWAILALAAPPIARLFTDDPAVRETMVLFLRLVTISFAFDGLFMVGIQSFNAVGKPGIAFAMQAGRILAVLIPLALLGSHLFGLVGLFGSVAAARVIGGLAGNRILRRRLGTPARNPEQAR